MRHLPSCGVLLVLALTGTAPPVRAAAAIDAATITRQGNGKGAAPCMACHGDDGAGQASAGYPRLAGLDAAYLQKQLDDFAGGSRGNAVMHPTAVALDEDERAALAHYYSRLPLAARAGRRRPAPRRRPRVPVPCWPRAATGTAACPPACNATVRVASASAPHFPPLAGQPATYIAAQLKAWQRGTPAQRSVAADAASFHRTERAGDPGRGRVVCGATAACRGSQPMKKASDAAVPARA